MYLAKTSDSGFAICRYGGYGITLSKRKKDGTEEWGKSYYGTIKNPTNNIVAQTMDGGYIITGQDTAVAAWDTTGTGALLVKTDQAGNQIWRKVLPAWFGGGVVETNDGSGYVVCGTSLKRMVMIKIDTGGNLVWKRNFGDTIRAEGKSIQTTLDGGFILTGNNYVPGIGSSLMLVKTDAFGNICSTGIEETQRKEYVKVYPSPAYEYVVIETHAPIRNSMLKIFSMTGQVVYTASFDSIKHRVETRGWHAGVYYFVLREGENLQTGKFVILE